jgi:dolichol-phosphate mannosyltransferase
MTDNSTWRDSGGVSIILAVLNERPNLEPLIARLTKAAPSVSELVFVDDGSEDGTVEFLQDLATRESRIRVISNVRRQTLTPAQCQGIEFSHGKYVIVMDADLQHPPECVPSMVDRLERGASLVVASRYAQGGSTGRRNPTRAVISRVAELVARMLLPPARRVTDPVSGFFGFRKSMFTAPSPSRRGHKLVLHTLTLSSFRQVEEVPYEFGNRTSGSTKIANGFGFVILYISELLRAWRGYHRLHRATRQRTDAASFALHEEQKASQLAIEDAGGIRARAAESLADHKS